MMKGRKETFDLEFDDQIELKGLLTKSIFCFNCRYGSGGCPFNPLAFINDGYFEV